jgi:predicted RNA binding protein YcfA (HicA-like mRNA interferase family)
MVKDARRLFIPNPHEGEIDASLLAKILKQAGIEPEEWLRL